MNLRQKVNIMAISVALLAGGCSLISRAAESSPVDTGKVEATSDDELSEQKIVFRQVDAAISANDFVALDKLDEQLRKSRARTPSGIWKLGAFHAELQFNLSNGISRKNGCIAPGAGFAGRWLRHSPNGPAAIITNASLLTEKAWCIRGSGYAGSVAKEAWTGFRAAIGEAFNLLTSTKAAASVDPEYYTVMSKVYRARNASQSESMALVREAADREPYYGRTYFEAVSNFLPRWGGSMEGVDQLARYAAERTRSSDKLGYYARVYWALEECGCIDMDANADWDTLKQAMNDVVERYPAPFNARHFMDIACKHGDVDGAMPFIEILTPGARSDADRIIWVKGCERSRALSG